MATEKEELGMVEYKITAKNPRAEEEPDEVVLLHVFLAEDADHGAFRLLLSKSKNVVSYEEVEAMNTVGARIERRVEEIEKQFEGDEEGLRAFLRRPIVGDIDSRFNGIRCKAASRGGVCSAKKREFEYATENPNNQGTWVCKDCGRLYSEEELLELRAEMDGEGACEVCGKSATIGINQPDGLLLYLCDKCYAERGIEEEEVWEVNP